MTNPTIQEADNPLNEQQLDALEQQLGVTLPAPYRAFLRAHNGGYPEPNAFPIEGDYADDHALLDWFLGVRPGQTRDLADYAQRYRDRVPAGFLPIGYDPGGNLICLVVDGPDSGKLFFWDHEREADSGEQPSYDNLAFVAPDFDTFLASLTELPDDEE